MKRSIYQVIMENSDCFKRLDSLSLCSLALWKIFGLETVSWRSCCYMYGCSSDSE